MDELAGREWKCEVEPDVAAIGGFGGVRRNEENPEGEEDEDDEGEGEDDEEENEKQEEQDYDKKNELEENEDAALRQRNQRKTHRKRRRAGGLLQLRFTINGHQIGVEGESVCGLWKGLQPATQLQVRVRAKNLSGWGQYSLPATVRSADAIPAPPTMPKIVSISAVSAVLHWSAPPSYVSEKEREN